jgi:uncharacterized protein (DUF1330 family)
MANASITDPAAVEAYAKVAGPAIRAAGGRNLVRDIPAKTFEAGLALRTIAIEFETIVAGERLVLRDANRECASREGACS